MNILASLSLSGLTFDMSQIHFVNFEELLDISSCYSRLQSFLRLNKVLVNFRDKCLRCCDGCKMLVGLWTIVGQGR